MTQLQPPERLVRTVSAWEGEAGRAWLDALPGRVADHLGRWELRAERVFNPGGQISMIVLVRRADGTSAVLKAGMVNAETRHEGAALARWDGRGAVRLLDADPADGVLLLERLQGDVSLRSLPEQKAMLEASALLQRLWVPPGDGHPFDSVMRPHGPARRHAAGPARAAVGGRRPPADRRSARRARARALRARP